MGRHALGLLVVAVMTSVGVAGAHDHKPPGASLRAKGGAQEGIMVTSCWIKGKDLGGAAFCTKREMSFPDPAPARPAATIVLETPREPAKVRVRAWRRLKENGRPRRPARRLDAVLREADDGWGVRVELPSRPGVWYLEAKGVWPDARFPESKQFALWTFAVRAG